jgi:hypothetical protein
MKTATFPALCFLTLAYCAGFIIIALVLLVVRSMPSTRPTTGINAQTLAQIFAVSNLESTVHKPLSNAAKKPKATITALIREEAMRKES